MAFLWILVAALAAVVLVGPLRRALVTAPALRVFRKVLPPTLRAAIPVEAVTAT